jgi:glycosyltransferase involved in cell wall biosynthesis
MAPELACVVLSLRNEPGLVAAVRSLLAQDTPAEIVVVNSGGGDPGATLRNAGISFVVTTRQERLNPGAVRNLGIATTSARFISFLAADCIAEPGWVSGRLREHRNGALAVASAITNAYPHNCCAWASYMLMFARRVPAPSVPRDDRLLFGVSYARELFERFGLFREDMRTGEDEEFNNRFIEVVPITWAPDVRTAHRHPTRLPALVLDQYRRGSRMSQAKFEIVGRPQAWHIARSTLRNLPLDVRYVWHGVDSQYQARLAGACLLIAPAVVAYVLGALLSPGAKITKS